MIQVRGVSKTYPNNIHALRNVNLAVDKGEFVFVVGASGAGKSTLVKCLYREEVPTRGTIVVDGRDVTTMKPGLVPYLRRDIGVVFQDFKLLPNKTVFENVAFALECTEAPQREIAKRVPAVLELVGMKDKAKAHAPELSGGEQQRVALARAIVNSPAVIMADEPTGNLDPDNSWAIMRILLELSRMGATVVVATHEQHIVNAMKQRVVAMEHGEVVRDELKGVYGREA
ncbi:MAG: cell division ATP-binding protein FtsE [Symbiobacteriia bacterium]